MNEPWQQLQQQLIDLQTQLAFQEDTIQTLDAIVIAQQQRLGQLEQSSARLEKQLAEIFGALDTQAASQRPPHY